MNDFTYQFGQFVNHDSHDANNPGDYPQSSNLPVPPNDPANLTGVIFFNRIARSPPYGNGVEYLEFSLGLNVKIV